MASVDVSGDVRGILTLDRQLVYAAALALTRTAKDSQQASIEAITQTFTTRGTWYLPSGRFGIRINPATKDRLESAVKTLADWLIPHETGEDKVPRSGRALAVPLVGPGRPRPSWASKVRRDLKPAVLGSKSVVLPTRGGPVLFYPRGNRLVAFYGLERRARIRKRSTVIEPTVRTVDRRFAENLVEALAGALRTAQ